jgi:hypothetical protein
LGYEFDRRALDDIYRRFVRLADKIKHVEDHHLLELIRDTHKPSGSATPLIEKLATATAAATPESRKPFPMAKAPAKAFGMPVPVPSEPQPEQEDYLWGV